MRAEFTWPSRGDYFTEDQRVLITSDVIAEIAADAVGKPFKDVDGNVIGRITDAKVEDGVIIMGARFDDPHYVGVFTMPEFLP